MTLQEDTLGEIRQVESDGCSYLDAISSYHLNRGKVVTKIAKYPHVEDFRQTVVELDEKQVCNKAQFLHDMKICILKKHIHFTHESYLMTLPQALSIRLIAVELKNHYAVLHDIICKNWDKIKKPRNANHDTMY